MKIQALLILTSGLLLTGCRTSPAHAGHSIKDVQVAILDATPRPATLAIKPFLPENAPKQFTEIAHLTVQGFASDEAKLINFLASKSRELGANGIIYGPAERPFTHYPASATDQTLRIYRAEAIIYAP